VNALAFEVPAALEAREPPEARGLRRDRVRLIVADRGSGSITHHRFAELDELLSAGDLLVLNVSATLPAALAARRPDGSALRVHVATRAPRLDPEWRGVELRSADGACPAAGRSGETLELAGNAELGLVAPYA
jgi:S-adenosylmethionine:tRNA ribosyltransferase-isomerase